MKNSFRKNTFLLLTMLFSGCITTQTHQDSEHFKMSQQVTQDIFVDGNRDKGIAALETYLAGHEIEYRKSGLKVSLLQIYGQLAQAYAQKGDFGKAYSNARKGLSLINEIEAQGLIRVDDEGSGNRVSGNRKIGPMDPSHYRELVFNGGKLQVYYAFRTYYEAAGDSAKADKWAVELQKAGEAQQLLTKKTAEGFYGKSVAAGGAEKPSKPTYDQDQYQRELFSAWALRAQILKKYRTGKTGGIEKLIDRWVEMMQSQDRLQEALKINMADARKNGLNEVADDYGRILDFYNRSVLAPWAMALKSCMLYETGRSKEALKLIKMANGQHLRAKRPDFRTPAGKAWFEQATVFEPGKVPLPWAVLEAQILTGLGQPEARSAWMKVQGRLKKTKVDIKNQIQYTFFRDHFEDQARLSLSKLSDGGDRKSSLKAIEALLRERESIRASFSVESHKMGYLSANKRLYERYLELSRFNPRLNLLGMERAKSRAMADLMARDLGQVNVPAFQDAARQKSSVQQSLAKSSGVSSRRALKQQEEKVLRRLEELRDQNPELYSLVSAEVPTMDQVRGLVPGNTAVISYYVTDKKLYINILTREKHLLKTVDISRGGLFAAVYDFRKRLFKGTGGTAGTRKKSGSIATNVDWRIEDGVETFSLKNRMPFPLEINSVTRVDHGYFPAKSYPFVNVPIDIQAGIDPLVRTVGSNESKTLFKRDRRQEITGGFITEIFVDTNVGGMNLKAVLLKTENEPPSLTVFEKTVPDFVPLGKGLYDILIAPVEKALQGTGQWVIVPHSMLHFLPFEALRDPKGEYLLKKHAISYTPSLGVLQQAKARNRGKKNRLMAFGDSLGDLKGARNEIEQIRRLFPQSNVFVGSQVTVDNVVANVGGGDVVHFACHGLFNPQEPMKSALVMAVPPEKGGRKGVRGQSRADFELLTVPKIMGLKCRPYLVTLSACDTGKARISGGDELIGLQRGFFAAGTPSLVTTLWPIADEPTVLLINRFYENLIQKGMNKAESLQEAKLFLIGNGFPEPYYWSAFVLQGDWR